MAAASPKKKTAKKKTTRKKKSKKAEPNSRGLTAAQVASGSPPAAVQALIGGIDAEGGQTLASYRDPLGGHWHVLASLPIAKVSPTPFQRDLSETHADKLVGVLERLDRFVDPIIAVAAPEGGYWTPNGNHRLQAMTRMGSKSIVALVLPDAEVAYQILALNTEKAHNVREKSLEVIRMARLLAELDPRPEKTFASEFEEAAYLTMGACYEQRGRFAGGAYQSVLKRIDVFLKDAMPQAIEARETMAARVLELDDAVAVAVKGLKERGFDSPYLKAFVIARINPLRFKRGATAEFEPTIDKMLASAEKFDVSKIKADQVANASGPPE